MPPSTGRRMAAMRPAQNRRRPAPPRLPRPGGEAEEYLMNETARAPVRLKNVLIGLVVVLALGALAFLIYGRLATMRRAATNPRWENYLKTHKGETNYAAIQAAYQQRQAV